MIKALIILPKTSRYSPSKVGNFLWSESHQAHLWGGRALEMDEFNKVSKQIFYLRMDEIANFDLPPYVQLVEEGKIARQDASPSTQDACAPSAKTLRPKLKRKTALIPIPDLALA
jgi:hypothetical protein